MKNLAVIPARSGSKGLPDKNIKELLGKPLMAYSLEAAVQSSLFDTIYLSTDSEEYAEIGRKYGAEAPFLRSKKNSNDSATSWAVLLEALEAYEKMGKQFDTIMMLQPTSPLRTTVDIRRAYQTMHEKKAFTVVSVCAAEHPPMWSNLLPEDHCMDGFLARAVPKIRQASSQYFRLNGAIYLFDVNHFQLNQGISYDENSYAYIMPAERSVDIDSSLDFLVAETLLRVRKSGMEPENAAGMV